MTTLTTPTPLQRAATRILLALRAEPALASATITEIVQPGGDTNRAAIEIKRASGASSTVTIAAQYEGGYSRFGYNRRAPTQTGLVALLAGDRWTRKHDTHLKYRATLHPDKIAGARLARVVATVVAALDREERRRKIDAQRERADAAADRIEQQLQNLGGDAITVRGDRFDPERFTLTLDRLTRAEAEAAVRAVAHLRK